MSSLLNYHLLLWNIFIQLFIISTIIQHTILANHSLHHTKEIVIIQWNYHEFSTHITVMLFLILLVCLKLAYHHSPFISAYVPESLLLILIGITFGSIVSYEIDKQSNTIEHSVWKFTPELFAYYLLPPIILESAYGLYNRTFSEYLGTILLFSVLGTICNFLIIGLLMYSLFQLGLLGTPLIQFDIKGFLLFSSIIVAVDPVAVLAIFHDIGVELSLYYIVFGESLFNDAITIVLNNIMLAFVSNKEITTLQILIGFISFFTVSFGGLFIGVIFGVLTCLITRIHSHLTVFTMLLLAYFSYIIADCIGWSGIISMISCGLIQAAYAFHNIGEKYVKSLHLITRMLAEVSEAVIFLFLGIQVISYKLEWHIGFILWGFILCLISRSIVILCITSIVNYVNVDETKITLSQQIVLIYGGLRGAVAFALSVLIPNDLFPINGLYHKNMIVTTTLCIILFTVGFMGITTKPLVKLLKIRKQDKHTLSLFHILNNSIIDQTLTGIETLIGSKGRNAIREFCIHIDEKYIRRILQRNPERYDEKILQVYEHIALKLLYASTHPKEIDNILKNIPESLKFNQYSRNNLLNNVTHDWIMKNHLSVVPIDDDYELHNNNNNITNNNNNNGNNDNDDGDTLDGESFISARQMMTTMNMNKKRHSKFSINTNDIHFDNLTQIDNRLSGYSMPKRKCQLDFNEAFSDLLQCRRETIKNHMTVNSNNNNNNLEMMNKNHFEHVNKMNCKTHQKTNELEKIQTLNIEHDTDDKQEKCGKIDSCIEQHHLVEQSTNNNASSSSFTHSLQPQIKDYRKNK